MNLFTTYPFFWPAVWHNVLWLLVLVFIATPIGMFFAVLLDREMRGTRIYQSAFFIPVVLSLAVVGFIWELSTRSQGFINSVLGRTSSDNAIDWLGDPSLNLWAVLVAASWRHVGYVMVLYLAGLKSVDPTLREAAAIDGANERQTFFRVVFPVMRPINVVIIVVTVIESLRAFDIVYIINQRQERPRAAVDPDHQQQHQRGQPGRVRLGDRGRPAGDLAGADRHLPDPDDAGATRMTATAPIATAADRPAASGVDGGSAGSGSPSTSS